MVLIKGTTIGTITDPSGNYKIIVNSAADILVFSQAGYRTQMIPVGSNTSINVSMEQDILALDFSRGNMLNSGEYTNSSSNKNENGNHSANTYVIREELPGYPGGTDALLKYIQGSLQYPEGAKKEGIQGQVLVTYIINTRGEVINPKILRGVSPDIDREALRITESIKGWVPAMQNGLPVSMVVTMPIEFRIK
jgi:TonB family protein